MIKADHKPKRRPKHVSSKPAADDDLRELAIVLDEHRLSQNAEGWFTIPWRDGRAALGLAISCFERNLDEFASLRESEAYSWLQHVYASPEIWAEYGGQFYHQASIYLERIDTEQVSPYLQAALRILQVYISNSSGGGAVYNELLRKAFAKTEPEHLLEDVVLEYRCRDALSTTSIMQSDVYDRQRRAFAIAWKRGLFHAAYSIAPLRKP